MLYLIMFILFRFNIEKKSICNISSIGVRWRSFLLLNSFPSVAFSFMDKKLKSNFVLIADIPPLQQFIRDEMSMYMTSSEYKVHGAPTPQRKTLIPGHPVVTIGHGNAQRDCKYCQKYKVKTKRGWNVKTKFKCETCNVNLCSGDLTSRNCFILYHEEFVFGSTPSRIYIPPKDFSN